MPNLTNKIYLHKTRGVLSVISSPVEMTPPPKYSVLLTILCPMTVPPYLSTMICGDFSFRSERGRSIKKRLFPHRRLNHPRFSLLRRDNRLLRIIGRHAIPDWRRRLGENHAQNLLRTRCRRIHPIPSVMFLS